MRHSIAVLLLLSIPLGMAGAEDEPYELFTFDVSALCAPRRAKLAPRLGPAGLVRNSEGLAYEPRQALEVDAIADIVRDTIAPACWDEGGDVQGRQGGLLLVKAPRSVAKEIGDLLAAFDSALGRRIRYSVATHRLPKSAWADLAAGEFTPTKKTRTAAVSGVAWAGVPAAVSVTNRYTWLADYDVEIATETAIADPVVASAREGLALDLTAWPTSDGKSVLLEVFVQGGIHTRPVRELALAPGGGLGSGLPQLGKVQLPDYRFLASSVTALVKPGRALVLPVVSGDVVDMVVIEVLGIEGGEEPGPVVHSGALCHRPRLNRLTIGALTPTIRRGQDAPGGAILFGAAKGGSILGGGSEDLMDLITQNVEPEAWESYEVKINPYHDDLILFAGPDIEAGVRGLVRRLEEKMLQPIRVEFAVWSVAGPVRTGARGSFAPDGGTIVCGGSIVGVDGRESFLVAGGLADHVADYEVEVARGACIPKPVIARTFEGLAANVAARFTSDSSLIEVDFGLLLATRHRPKTAVHPGADAIGPVELVEVAEIRLDQTVRTTAGGVYVLDLGADPGDSARTLALVIRPIVE